jgi:hypothetical protein
VELFEDGFEEVPFKLLSEEYRDFFPPSMVGCGRGRAREDERKVWSA